jgi:hypothetical protein
MASRNDSNSGNNHGGSSRSGMSASSSGSGKQGSSRSGGNASGDMSVREAGQKGGQRVRELVEEGKESEGGRGDGNR